MATGHPPHAGSGQCRHKTWALSCAVGIVVCPIRMGGFVTYASTGLCAPHGGHRRPLQRLRACKFLCSAFAERKCSYRGDSKKLPGQRPGGFGASAAGGREVTNTRREARPLFCPAGGAAPPGKNSVNRPPIPSRAAAAPAGENTRNVFFPPPSARWPCRVRTLCRQRHTCARCAAHTPRASPPCGGPCRQGGARPARARTACCAWPCTAQLPCGFGHVCRPGAPGADQATRAVRLPAHLALEQAHGRTGAVFAPRGRCLD